ncbi:MAG: hypothetical protein QOG55_764 [Acidobacteriaceae bacterium]|nr:hypothetical protein [Acidobacteriaceae bacterium]
MSTSMPAYTSGTLPPGAAGPHGRGVRVGGGVKPFVEQAEKPAKRQVKAAGDQVFFRASRLQQQSG